MNVSEAKVYFHLEQDADGYPPVAVESVWASPVGDWGECMLDNVPFFATQATLGDTVRTVDEDGVHWFRSVVKGSLNSLIRLVFFDVGRVAEVREALVGLGCSSEFVDRYNLLAVNIPATSSLSRVQQYVRSLATEEALDFEEPILRQVGLAVGDTRR